MTTLNKRTWWWARLCCRSLVDTRCGVHASHQQDYLVFYLCAVFVPICPAGFHLSDVPGRSGGSGPAAVDAERAWIPPCRAVCDVAREGCEPVMRRYNVSWPPELDCERWPTQDRGICISPASISLLSNKSDVAHASASGRLYSSYRFVVIAVEETFILQLKKHTNVS